MDELGGFKLEFNVDKGRLTKPRAKTGTRHKVQTKEADKIVERLEKLVTKTPLLPKDKTKDGPLAQFTPDPLENYIPRARVFYIAQHECPECGERSKHTAADLLEYSRPENVAGKNVIRTRAFAASDFRWGNLPRRVEYLEVERQICPCCLAVIEEIDAGQLQTELQLALPIDAPIPEAPAASKPRLWTHHDSVAEFKKARKQVAKQEKQDDE